jgi:DNA-binding response OmpR family regulator
MLPTTAETPFGDTATTLHTILVVEDEDTIRKSVAKFLRQCGYGVIEAGDAREARDLLADRHVDLVFSDINMPNRESGFALEKWVRQNCPGVQVLLTACFPQSGADTRDLRQPIVSKPYSYAALLRRIDGVFARGSQRSH